jgi:hypothetical protein
LAPDRLLFLSLSPYHRVWLVDWLSWVACIHPCRFAIDQARWGNDRRYLENRGSLTFDICWKVNLLMYSNNCVPCALNIQ